MGIRRACKSFDLKWRALLLLHSELQGRAKGISRGQGIYVLTQELICSGSTALKSCIMMDTGRS